MNNNDKVPTRRIYSENSNIVTMKNVFLYISHCIGYLFLYHTDWKIGLGVTIIVTTNRMQEILRG